ncbi:MAG: 16S rRNA (adenine(1518)-N(6)/adenine(1519)-N(6))-dimethyltransferase RsmA [Candidatus Marsarchaeota archaeon]|nr:16S rRNA (adenine(1518)-N(6)/adenine(1519)-N(6))-dimethyltransferase RsmA [Candidatus Marsarchaeota archaeon]
MVFEMRKNQVFLNNEPILDFIAGMTSGRILEIGGGHGELTKHLAKKGRVTVVELDEKLSGKIKIPGVEVISKDALEVDFDGYDFITGNLPYNISSQIIIKFLESNTKKAIFTVQKELAKRMVAKPGSRDYSKLSVNVQNVGICNILKIIPPEFFNPKPKVFSAVVELKKNKKPILITELDWKIVNFIFQHKNQNIGKVLKREGFKTNSDPVFLKKARNIEIEEIKKISRYF